VPHRIIRSWYTGRWRVGCYIWYSDEGPGRAAAPPSPLLAVPNVTAHPSTVSVPITVLLYDGPLLCGFNVAIKRLSRFRIETINFFACMTAHFIWPTASLWVISQTSIFSAPSINLPTVYFCFSFKVFCSTFPLRTDCLAGQMLFNRLWVNL